MFMSDLENIEKMEHSWPLSLRWAMKESKVESEQCGVKDAQWAL